MSTDVTEADAPPLRKPERTHTLHPSRWGASVAEPFVVAGGMVQLLIKVMGMLARRPWGFWREVGEHSFDFFKMTWFPGALAVFGWGFGAPGLSGGALMYIFGVPDRLGAFFNMALLREGAPFIFGMVMAGVVGTAITADLGARRIRDEIDAMSVLGVDPVRALVLPRVVATTLMAGVMSVLAILVGLASGWYAAGPVFGAAFPAYVDSIVDVLTTKELLAAVIKTALFGLVTAVVCAYMGLNTKGGSSGVGRAVNQAVVITFAVVWVINFVYTMTLLGLNPDLHVYK